MRKAVALTLVMFGIYAWRLPQAFYWDSDWGRDLYDMIKIARGDVSLLGPPLTGAVFSGPYYYYFFVPPLLLGENWVLLVNAAVFAAAVGITAVVWGWPAGLAVGLAPFWITAARHPGNAYSYLPWLLAVLLTGWKKKRWKRRSLLSWGWLAGVAVNFHPAAGIAILPVAVKVWRRAGSLWWLAAFLVTFGPLAVFEIRHDGIMTRAVASGKFWQLSLAKIGQGTESHYLLPLGAAVVWAVTDWAVRRRRVVLVVLIGLWLAVFPTGLYAPSGRTGERFAAAVKAVRKAGWLDGGEPFNLISVTDEEKLVVSGNEYRYFLARSGREPLLVTDYRSAGSLLVFSEMGELDIKDLKMWETEEFGEENFTDVLSLEVGPVRIYRAARTAGE